MTPTTDPIRRAIRVAMVLLGAAIPGVPGLAATFDVPAGRVAQITAVFSFAVVILTALRNYLEDNTAMPAVLKAPPATGENPVPNPEPDPIPSRPIKKVKKAAKKQGGVSDVGLLVVVLLIVVIVLVIWGVPPR